MSGQLLTVRSWWESTTRRGTSDNQARSTSGVRWYETRDITPGELSTGPCVPLCLSTSFLGDRQGIESLRYLTWLSRRLIKSWSLMLLFREGKRLVEGTPSLQVQ